MFTRVAHANHLPCLSLQRLGQLPFQPVAVVADVGEQVRRSVDHRRPGEHAVLHVPVAGGRLVHALQRCAVLELNMRMRMGYLLQFQHRNLQLLGVLQIETQKIQTTQNNKYLKIRKPFDAGYF